VKVLGHEVDAFWPDRRFIAEVDGPGHARPRARRRDHTRDKELRAAG
jgi:very-short-patch-repair endonuclease